MWNRVGKVRNPATGRKVPRINPRSEWRRVDAPHLRIVPEDLWLAVQQRLAQRRNGLHALTTAPRRALSCLLRCGACGSSIVSAGSKRGRPVAACSRARESGDCSNRRNHPLDTIEQAVLEGLRAELAHPLVIEEARRAYEAEWARLTRDRSRERATAERRLQERGARSSG